MELVGGQAVVEGVMMMSPERVAVAVRRPDGRVERKVEGRHPLMKKWRRVVVVRGVVALVEMVFLGTRALVWSADVASGEERRGRLSWWGVLVMVLVSLGLAVGLFVVLPFFVAGFVSRQHVVFNVVEGLVRVVVFVVYLLVIAQMKEVRRVFAYHGAEHMAVRCYEERKRLTVRNVMGFDTVHPRCGTAFLFIVLVVSSFVFSVVVSDRWWVKLVSRVVLIPVVAAVSYEVLRFSARHQRRWWVRWLVAPGLWFQRITTRRPDVKQVEVALVSLRAVV